MLLVKVFLLLLLASKMFSFALWSTCTANLASVTMVWSGSSRDAYVCTDSSEVAFTVFTSRYKLIKAAE